LPKSNLVDFQMNRSRRVLQRGLPQQLPQIITKITADSIRNEDTTNEIGIWLTVEVVLEEGELEADAVYSAGFRRGR
jgi:hypothetical protein